MAAAESMTAVEIGLVAEELARLADGARIQRVHARAPAGVVLELRAPGCTRLLLIVADPPLTRMHLVEARPERPERAPEFVRQLRRQLEGARITGVETTPGDRFARLTTDRGTLVAELTGRHGNLLFADPSGTIRAIARPLRSERRRLEPGAPYAPPARRDAASAARARAAAPRLGLDAQPADGARSRALAAHFEPLERETRLDDRREALARALRRAQKGLERRARALEADLEAAAGADLDRLRAEALVALGKPRKRGLSSVRAVDWSDPETPELEVELDPALTIQENADRLFKRHRKLTRSRATVEARLHAAREAVAAIGRARERVSQPAADADLEALSRELVEAGHLSERALRGGAGGGAARAARAEVARALPYRTYTSRSGREILVGRSASGNDELSLRVARGSDAWFHAEGASGSHVVLRLRRGEDPDPESLIDAATLAAHFSQAARSGKVGVIWTRAARVRKPRGTKPGLVTATGTRSLTVRLEPQRLARLLGRERAPGAPQETDPGRDRSR
ncbi:MAG: NFACT family protein [Deltaproteobacteria bacterium]|nr:MAG: NFACT family protein [Deltaproteobacteria bacterium]